MLDAGDELGDIGIAGGAVEAADGATGVGEDEAGGVVEGAIDVAEFEAVALGGVGGFGGVAFDVGGEGFRGVVGGGGRLQGVPGLPREF